MRRFSSYGPIDSDLHYHAPRKTLIKKAADHLTGEDPRKGGHYITVWAPRQTGKTWVMQEAVQLLKKENQYAVGILSIEALKNETDEKEIAAAFTQKLTDTFQIQFPPIDKIRDIPSMFTQQYFKKPVILIIDEFDSLDETLISSFAGVFRDIYIGRSNQRDRESADKTHLLHGLALIGVRSVLGIEIQRGSPFNVQKGLHIPNLTADEVNDIFKWYQKESGQTIEKAVIDRVYGETRGQPGLTCWFGELLTETYNEKTDRPIAMPQFERVWEAAVHLLPNSNILNIISKAKQEPHKDLVLELFRTDKVFGFKFDDRSTNFLYMNGVIEPVEAGKKSVIRFACPFVQKRLFNYFSYDLFREMDRLVEPFDNLEDAITEDSLNIRNILVRYQDYLTKNGARLFKDAPRRKDLRIYEAVFHFNLYMYLCEFLEARGGGVYPEFPTGNGKIDLIVTYKNRRYGLELKTYSDAGRYKKALTRAAEYGRQLELKEICLVFFIEAVGAESRQTYEVPYLDQTTGVTVTPVFIETGN